MTFDFNPVPRIQFGVGRFDGLAELVRPLGARVLVVHNADALVPRLTALLGGASVAFHRQRGEPTTEDVERAVELAKREGSDCLIWLGGGSAIDCAKAAAGLLTNGGTPIDYMEVVGRGKKIARPCAPWIAIPTTAGTGAEATRNAVVALPVSAATPFKASIRSEHLLPRGIVIDPQLHVNVPPEVTARSGMDAVCQCIESYTSTAANPMTDALALQGVALAARSLRRCYEHGEDVEARGEMALAALLSGICLTSAGLGAVHGFAAPLGAHYPVPHGVVCAALLPQVMEANMAALAAENVDHPGLRRYAVMGRMLAGDAGLSDGEARAAGVAVVRGLNTAMSIPRLSAFGLSAEAVPAMVELAKKASSMRYNPVTLPDDALAGVLRGAI